MLWKSKNILILLAWISCLGSTLELPDLNEMRRRALPWRHLTVDLAWDEPRSFRLLGLLSASERALLVDLARVAFRDHQTPIGAFQGMVPLDKHPHLNASKILKKLDKRLSILTGLPQTNVEEGYLSLYTAGFEGGSLHLDNHHGFFDPLRVASFVIYLVGEEEGLVGGGTVFPLAPASPLDVSDAEEISHSVIAQWDASLEEGLFQRGVNPQGSRICPMLTKVGDGALQTDPCPITLEVSRKLCSSAASSQGQVHRQSRVIDAVGGDGVLFFHNGSNGRLSSKALHGACPVTHHHKVVLAKFVRSRPRPYDSDERAFSSALELWKNLRAIGETRIEPSASEQQPVNEKTNQKHTSKKAHRRGTKKRGNKKNPKKGKR